jgi:radical SAM protein with 4Fe4S-binding SPASM domain
MDMATEVKSKAVKVGKRSALPAGLVLKMARTPGVLKRVLKAMWRKHVGINADYNRPDGSSKPFQLISMRITNLCNHRCAVCAQWGETGYNLTRSGQEIRASVPVETYMKMIDEVAQYDPMVYITGGEPTMYPGLLDFIKHCKSKGLTVNIVTNGFKLAEMADELVRVGLDEISVSLDGPKAMHDECRGLPGAYDLVVEAIQAVQKAKRKQRRVKPYVLTITTVGKRNAAHLTEVMDDAAPLEPDLMAVYYSWFTSRERGEAHCQILEEAFDDAHPIAWKGYVRLFPQASIDELKKSVRKIKAPGYPHRVFFIPDVPIDQLEDYYHDLGEMFGYKRCINPWLEVNIMPNGDVVPCRDHPDVVMGNVTQQSLLDIYNNEKYRKFRRLLRDRGGLLPICARCCGLMGF